MGDRIFVIETLFDGAEGYPYDEILSIGVCSVDLDEAVVEPVFEAVIAKEPKYLGKVKLDYAESKGFDVGSLYVGEPEAEVVRKFKEIVKGGYVTSYDIRQEFNKYFINNPWDLTFEAEVMPSIMNRQPISFRCKYPEDEPDIIRKAYRRMFKNDPAGIGKGRTAMDLAKMASYIAINLRSRGKY
ncbi:MAG: hypothetical protein MJZ68_03010 [archaeon]|nr:hypothetical protein [archaeon]